MTLEQLKTRPTLKAGRGYRILGAESKPLTEIPSWAIGCRMTGFSVINGEECDLFEGYLDGGRWRFAQPLSITRSTAA